MKTKTHLLRCSAIVMAEAAATFRDYEKLHRERGPEHEHKAERNRLIAEKLERMLQEISDVQA